MKSPKAPATLSSQELAKELDLSLSRLDQLVSAGMPVFEGRRRGVPRRFERSAALTWLVRRRLRARRANGSAGLAEMRLQLVREKVRAMVLKNDAKEKTLIDRTKAAAIERRGERNHLRGGARGPGKIAAAIAAEPDQWKVHALLRDAFTGALQAAADRIGQQGSTMISKIVHILFRRRRAVAPPDAWPWRRHRAFNCLVADLTEDDLLDAPRERPRSRETGWLHGRDVIKRLGL